MNIEFIFYIQIYIYINIYIKFIFFYSYHSKSHFREDISSCQVGLGAQF